MILSVQNTILYGAHSVSVDAVVLEVQKALNILARQTVVPEDGIFDKQTVDQIRLFQAAHRVAATGAINNETIQHLNRKLAAIMAENNYF